MQGFALLTRNRVVLVLVTARYSRFRIYQIRNLGSMAWCLMSHAS